MSITAEMAKDHAKDPAVLCCRAEAGTIIEPARLEDPSIFPDLVDSGLLTIPEDVLLIEQVLGATLKETADSLVPLTAAMVDGIQTAAPEADDSEETEMLVPASVPAATPVNAAPIMPIKGIKIIFPITLTRAETLVATNIFFSFLLIINIQFV